MPNIHHSDFVDYLLSEKIKDLLLTINVLEPTLFKKKYIDIELDTILSNIKKDNIDVITLNNSIIKKNQIKENKRKIKNNEKNKLKNQTVIKKKQYSEDNRCHARIWGPIFKMDGNYIYGEQCHKKKGNNSNYCYIHQCKLSHGDYFKEPNIMIREHFEKDSKIVKITYKDEKSNKNKNKSIKKSKDNTCNKSKNKSINMNKSINKSKCNSCNKSKK
jgi:hypothetical protein